MTTESEMKQVGAMRPRYRLALYRLRDGLIKTCVGYKRVLPVATQEKRWNKVKALQHLLTHSLSGKLLAVKRVTENSGKRTSGLGLA
ncbi:MAG: reverse transcriptase N-terminal domain-containing protein [Pyrinomonadaceae bacterium]